MNSSPFSIVSTRCLLQGRYSVSHSLVYCPRTLKRRKSTSPQSETSISSVWNMLDRWEDFMKKFQKQANNLQKQNAQGLTQEGNSPFAWHHLVAAVRRMFFQAKPFNLQQIVRTWPSDCSDMRPIYQHYNVTVEHWTSIETFLRRRTVWGDARPDQVADIFRHGPGNPNSRFAQKLLAHDLAVKSPHWSGMGSYEPQTYARLLTESAAVLLQTEAPYNYLYSYKACFALHVAVHLGDLEAAAWLAMYQPVPSFKQDMQRWKLSGQRARLPNLSAAYNLLTRHLHDPSTPWQAKAAWITMFISQHLRSDRPPTSVADAAAAAAPIVNNPTTTQNSNQLPPQQEDITTSLKLLCDIMRYEIVPDKPGVSLAGGQHLEHRQFFEHPAIQTIQIVDRYRTRFPSSIAPSFNDRLETYREEAVQTLKTYNHPAVSYLLLKRSEPGTDEWAAHLKQVMLLPNSHALWLRLVLCWDRLGLVKASETTLLKAITADTTEIPHMWPMAIASLTNEHLAKQSPALLVYRAISVAALTWRAKEFTMGLEALQTAQRTLQEYNKTSPMTSQIEMEIKLYQSTGELGTKVWTTETGQKNIDRTCKLDLALKDAQKDLDAIFL